MTPSRRRRQQQLRALATAAAVVALAVALLACQGGPSGTDASSRSARAEERALDAGSAAGEAPSVGSAEEAADEAADAAAPPLAVPVATRGVGSPARPEQEPPADGAPGPQAARPPADPPVIEDLWPVKGPASGGDRVEIRGRNLRPSLVLFGSVPATVLGVREEGGTVTLTLEAPPARAGAAKVHVVVTNPDGQYAVAGERFEYYN